MDQPRELNDAEICEMLQMFNQGWTIKEIAIYFGVSTDRVLTIRGGDYYGRKATIQRHPSTRQRPRDHRPDYSPEDHGAHH